MKNLDLTFVRICNERAEITARNKRAEQYIKSKESKLEKVLNKILPFMIGLSLASSIIALCIVEYVHYDVFGTLF